MRDLFIFIYITGKARTYRHKKKMSTYVDILLLFR